MVCIANCRNHKNSDIVIGKAIELVGAFLQANFTNAERHLCRLNKVEPFQTQYFG